MTTLALMGVEVARHKGMSVTRVAATHASRGLPFGAFASVLPPGAGGYGGPARGDQAELLRRYGQALVEGAGGRPLVLFVDDAQLLDDGAATLVHQLAMTRAATAVLTVRAGEDAPDPLVSLWKDGRAERIELRVIDDAEVEELLTRFLGGPMDPASLRQLADRCQGNPLYLREMVTGALETGVLFDDGGLWRIRDSLRPTGRLVELVAERLGDLADPERTVLEMLALAEPLGQARMAEIDDPEVVRALENKGLITSRFNGRRLELWLAHPIYGDVVRVGISAARERTLARLLAQVVEGTGGRRRDDALLLASWRLVAGGGSPQLFLVGAAAAAARHDYDLTERLARAAVREGGGLEARFWAAEAAHFQGRPEQAEHELAALAVDATSDADRARIAEARFDNAYFLTGEPDFGPLDEVAGTIADPARRHALVSRHLFATCLSRGPRATLSAAPALYQRPPDGPLTLGHVAVVHSLVRLGRLEHAVALVGPVRSGGRAPAVDAPWEEWDAFGAGTSALVHAGRLAEAEQLLTRAYDDVVDQPTEARAYLAGQLAFLHLEQGRVRSAFRRASEQRALFRQLGRTLCSRWGYIAAAQALACAGQADEAAETLATLDGLGLPAVLLDETELLQAQAWTAAAAGDLSAARRQLEVAADLGEEVGDLYGAARALHGLARLGGSRQAAPRLAVLASQVEGEMVAARATYATAHAARDSLALDQVSRDFERMGATLYAAEAVADAAVVLRRAGRVRAAAAAEQKAARLLAGCEGTATPAVEFISARVSLTPGELAVALKAAAGLSNKDIAKDIYLSVRTVESHLQRTYEKLGISGRHDLADALRNAPAA
jgi:DNA-binding NarL/FixJ family response regulator